MNENSLLLSLTWSFLRGSVFLGLLFALGGCQTTAYSPEGSRGCLFTERTEHFLQALASLDELSDPNDVFWLVNIYLEGSQTRAWVSEVRDEVLHVYDVELSYETRTLRVLETSQYEHFTPPRKDSLIHAFTTPTHFMSYRDYWGSLDYISLSGYGRVYVETVNPDSDRENNQVVQWIAGSNAPLGRIRTDDYVPIELALPWLISRYYAAGR